MLESCGVVGGKVSDFENDYTVAGLYLFGYPAIVQQKRNIRK